MRLPPSYSEFPRFPVIGGTSLLAIGVTIAYWGHGNVEPLFETPMIRQGEYWRLLTCMLLHGDIMHLLFNIYWFWVLGTVLEETFGHFRTALMVVMLGIGSAAFEFAFLEGGIGLSGVVYGLFGVIWVLGYHDPRFSDVIDKRTVQIFIGWFFLCIVLTAINVLPVANIAHGSGAILGILIGFASVDTPFRKLSFLALMIFFVFGLWGATIGRPHLNFSRSRGQAEAYWAYGALSEGHYQESERWFKDLVVYRPKDAEYWYDLGIMQDRLMHTAGAVDSFEHTIALGDPRGEIAIGNIYQNGAYGWPKDEKKAISYYLRGSEHGDPDGDNAVAWLYATSKDPTVFNPAAALEYAHKAVDSNKDEPDAARLDTLAKAYSVNGKFEEAVKAETQALAHADPEDVKDFRQRLQEYQNAILANQKAEQPKIVITKH